MTNTPQRDFNEQKTTGLLFTESGELCCQLPASEKAALERFILESSSRLQNYFEVSRRADWHLESFTNDFILLKG
jgi:hypothetical protein